MSLFVATTWAYIAVGVSIAYSYHMAQKAKKAAERARKEAERQADLAKGFQFTEEGQAKALPIVYGRNKIGGVRVHFKVADSYKFSNAASSGIVFESMKQPDNAEPIVWKLTNSNSNWTGTWSYAASTKAEFLNNPGWIATKEDPRAWKLPDRAYVNDVIAYTAPSIDFVFIPFQNGSDTSIKPQASLSELGFDFPIREGTIPVLDKDVAGEKNEFFFVQQALCQGGLSNIYNVDVDSRPYTYNAYNYGLRIHAYKNGGIVDPLMTANDSTRSAARFTKVAYSTQAFKLNRDDPQHNGTPEVQFYVEGNSIRSITKSNSNYTLNPTKVYSNNAALVLLDYLTNTEYGKGVAEEDIDLESFYKASKVCDIVVKSNVAKKGILNISKGGTKDIRLCEANITLDSATSSRENIQTLLDIMPLSALVWTEGKYRLNMPYAYVYDAVQQYSTGDIVQVTDNSGKNRLFSALSSNIGANPLTSNVWVEDVIPDDFKTLTDDDLIRDTELVISWPDASTKLNFCTVRFSNEEQDFAEDTVCWPEKEPTDSSNTVYQTFLAEDNNVPLETETFEAGCTTPYSALARAEQKVRASRDIVVYTFKATASVFALEPGDLFGFESQIFSVPYTVLKVDEVETEEGGIVKISASTFDARLLAWNVPDDFYTPLPDTFEGYVIKQAKDLKMLIGESQNKTSNYVLTWTGANDNRVTRYIVKYTTDSISNITSATAWTDLGVTTSLRFELPALDGTFTFTVVAVSASGKTAPFRNVAEGSQWPLINYSLSSSFLNSAESVTVALTNDVAAIITDSGGTVVSDGYYYSGTDIKVYSGSLSLIYDGVGTTPGTWKVAIPSGNQVNITAGAISALSSDLSVARVGNHSAITSSVATISYVISGTTVAGATFSYTKIQTIKKKTISYNVKALKLTSSDFAIFKDAANKTLSGVHSSVVVTAKKYIGFTESDFTGYLTVQADTDVSQSVRYPNAVTLSPTNTASVSQYTIRLYDTASSSEVLAEEIIPVVFKGNKGSSALNVILSNSTHAIPAASNGTPLDYSNSGTAIYVYEGGSRLLYDGVGTTTGTWKFTASASNITTGAVTDSSDFATIGNHSGMTAETAAIVYTISGRTSEGIAFALEGVQTFVKARKGETIIEAFLSNTGYVFPTDENGTITSYAGTSTEIAVYEGNTKLQYNGTGTTNGTWKVVAAGNNITAGAPLTIVNGTDVNYPVASAMTADSANLVFTITGKSSAGQAFTLTKTQAFTKNRQGVTGKKSAVVQLFAWSTVQPTAPAGNSSYTWSTLSNGTYTKANGEPTAWVNSIPSNPGTPLIKLWTATKRIEAVNNASLTDISWVGAEVAAVTQNGQAGLNTATAVLYKWSTTIPTAPSGTNTWTWTSNDFDAVSSANSSAGWSKTPSAPTAGMTLWAAEVKLSDTSTNATTVVNWTTSSIGARAYAGTNGLKGDQGNVGNQGASYRLCFAKSATATATAQTYTTAGNSSFVANGSWGLASSVWSGSAPALSAGEYLWQSDGVYDPATNITTWTTPYWSSLKVGNLSAIAANLGTITAGKLENNGFVIDLTNKTITISV
jgi:hypothetical protein